MVVQFSLFSILTFFLSFFFNLLVNLVGEPFLVCIMSPSLGFCLVISSGSVGYLTISIQIMFCPGQRDNWNLLWAEHQLEECSKASPSGSLSRKLTPPSDYKCFLFGGKNGLHYFLWACGYKAQFLHSVSVGWEKSLGREVVSFGLHSRFFCENSCVCSTHTHKSTKAKPRNFVHFLHFVFCFLFPTPFTKLPSFSLLWCDE